MSLNQPGRKFKYEITVVERVAVEIKSAEYSARLARAAEALCPLLTSSESLENSASSGKTILPLSIFMNP
ncbi:MAG: hypothetical protein H7301_05770 [Cryobacterium sp.]|nr:hypothetical protein [Oligoflexia bacterium]